MPCGVLRLARGQMAAHRLGGKPCLCQVRPLLGSVGDSVDDNLAEWTEPR